MNTIEILKNLTELQDKCFELKIKPSEVNFLIQELEHDICYIGELNSEIEQLKQKIKKANKQINDQEKYYKDNIKELKQRIDKTLNFIKKQKPWWEEWHYDGCGVDDDIKEIEKMLKGGE